jgi:hypothetical protein
LQFDNSDSEEDEDVLTNLQPIYESHNVYHLRRLPHVVGSNKFMVSSKCQIVAFENVSKGRFANKKTKRFISLNLLFLMDQPVDLLSFQPTKLSICNICVKQKILVINEMKFC